MVKGHSVKSKTIQDAFDVTERFFDLPIEDKQSIKMTDDYAYGYTADENLALTKAMQGKTEAERLKYLKENRDLKET